MSGGTGHHTEHTIAVAAAPRIVYALIADVSAWSHLFPPTIHAERTAGDDVEEQIRLWALANDEVKTWTSRRWLDPGSRRIRFQQEISHPPVASMIGEWSMRPGPDGGTTLVLTHDFSVLNDDSEAAEYIVQTIDRNSGAELAAIKTATERHADLPDLVLSFEDSVVVDGDLSQVYDFIYRCQDWPKRLPHVARLSLQENEPGLQVMEMDTRTPGGDVHTTRSVRVCFPRTRIVYRQTVLPPLMAAHTGRWLFTESRNGVHAVSRHTVVIRPEAVPALLGAGSTIKDARSRIRETLGANSMATLRQAKAHVESGHG